MEPFAAILKRVEQKKQDYTNYGFAKLEMAALNTFFDLAQEYDGLENLFRISVAVPKVFLGIESILYVTDANNDTLRAVAHSASGMNNVPEKVPAHITISEKLYRHDRSYVFPIQGKNTPASHLLLHGTGDMLGMFEVFSEEELPQDIVFFIQKYINRVGYNLYNKFLTEQNIQHLKFINNLVADIEHNVIVPNLRYKYYFKKIRRYLHATQDIEKDLEEILAGLKGGKPDLYAKLSGVVEWLVVANRSMFEDQEKIERHYKHASLFLESLFRKDHFVFGNYVLNKTSCLFWKEIIFPQLERYADRFRQQGIQVEDAVDTGKKQQELELKADKGLIAQVVANLFSNVAKYTTSTNDGSGEKKHMLCETALIEDFFGKGVHGVRFQVFSSGEPISKKDSERIFDEGFRLTDSESIKGTGHGLHFVKNVVEVHGGIVGHIAEKLGNQFYFVIPS